MACYQFEGQLELDVSGYELRLAGRPVPLERIPMEILLLLVERRGELVTREQIADRVWGAGVFIDLDNSINGAIRKLRRALADDSDHPRFIQTVTGKGYRFIAPIATGQEPGGAIGDESSSVDSASVVAPVTNSASAVLAAPVLDAAPAMAAPQRPSRWRRWPALAVGFALLVALGTYGYSSRSTSGTAPRNTRVMLAVLPFENLTGDAGQEYFSDGLTEAMISRLGNIDHRRLGVIARTSVMRYKAGPEPLERLARELGVDYALEGSVQRDAGRIRITAQLIEVTDQTHLWARQYDREQGDLLAVQDEIAKAVADQIRLTLADLEQLEIEPGAPLPPDRYEAYDLYLRGRYFWNKRTPKALQSAVESFEQAVARDPSYAQAYAGLADAYALVGAYSLAPQQECMPKARVAALRALELDPGLAEARTSLAVIVRNYDWNWEAAESEFRRAIELDPNYATAHHWYAEHLALRGRFEEAFDEIERARRLDPLSLIMATDHAVFLYFARHFDRAIPHFRSVLEREPDFPRAYMLAYAYVQTGKFAEALALLDEWRRVDDTPWIPAIETYVHGRAGDHTAARRALAELEAFEPGQPIDLGPYVVARIGVGDLDEAVGLLQRCYAERSPGLTALLVDPIYDPLRGDPRFHELLRGVNLGS